MASTLTKLLLHTTFSTKERRELIAPAIEADLYAYVGGICRRMESPLLAMGGTANHVHLLISLSKNVALSNLMLNVKRDSSRWMNRGHAMLDRFNWQDGYFAFSIGESGADALRAYIACQKQHHRKIDFKEEVRTLLRKYGIAWEETYVWD